MISLDWLHFRACDLNQDTCSVVYSVKAMLLLIDCKYKLISEYRLPRREKAKVESSPKKSLEAESEAIEDGLLSLKGAKQEIVNLITEEEVNRVCYIDVLAYIDVLILDICKANWSWRDIIFG